ncbi:energy transducer TonB [Pseudomonas sp. N040]|uniref:energy transducer TonB n=1 Tax=Pseudomonas sp. N040 TaxID=2785325 RepID=UPI0018A2D0E7|nr:energy transducer TonB [Pseudomonas sp. N040]MBF7730647.1 energy transducer TonB [Pseudomonas sp. N040]MBW7014290.1 energy transducer TonB [Pseudomonas sp. N040]
MIAELRRRAYLNAMQVVSWLPTQVLPFAAASRAELLHPQQALAAEPLVTPGESVPVQPLVVVPRAADGAINDVRARLEQARQVVEPQVAAKVQVEEPPAAITPALAIPRFSLQLYRAGACLLLVELPTGEAFQSRDPAYLLLKDLLRAAGLPDSPQLLGDPVRWPLLAGGNLDQGPDAARDFLQGYLAARMEDQPGCACLWLVGLPAMRHAGEVEEDMYNRELQIDELGAAWALPGLELLMDEPQRKAPLWQAMRRVMQRWQPANE